MRTARTLALVSTLALLAGGCSSIDVGGMSGMMDGEMHGGRGSGTAPTPVEGAETVTVVAVDVDFETDAIDLIAGEPTNITLVNEGDAFHDLHVDGTDFGLDADPDERTSGALTISEPGTYEYRCTVPGHAAAGMTGTITVTA